MRIAYLAPLVLLLVACTQSVVDVKTEDMVGKTVVLRGTVESTVKIGSLSGYTLKDKAGDTISVSAQALPVEGDEVTVRGVLIKTRSLVTTSKQTSNLKTSLLVLVVDIKEQDSIFPFIVRVAEPKRRQTQFASPSARITHRLANGRIKQNTVAQRVDALLQFSVP